MVRKEEFFNDVMERAKEYYEGRARVTMHDVSKNNSFKKMGLCVTLLGGNCGPTIYLDDYFDDYENGQSFDSVFNDIVSMLDRHLVENKVDVSFFTDFNKVYDSICFRVVGAKKNEERLKERPYRLIEDLAVIYYISMKSRGIEGSVAIKNTLMDIWNVSEEDLFEAAMDNTPRIYPANILPMSKFMSRQTGQKLMLDDFFTTGFLVGSNTECINGANVILYPELLKKVGEQFDSNYFIIPSSVHEVLFVKELFYQGDTKTLEDMIHVVNSSCVLPEDVLSDSLYYYDRAAENKIKKVEQVKDTMLL